MNRASREIEGHDESSEIESTYKVEPVEATEKHGVEHSTENPNNTPENIHPYLGHNFDIKA